MRIATRTGLLTCLVALWAAPAFAQDPNVTFQVDMNPYIATCQHDPETDDVQIRGTIFGWDDTAPAMDDDGDGTYSITVPIANGTVVGYKFFSTGGLEYEDQTGDRMYTVTADADQTVDEVTFADGDPVDDCGTMTTPEDYEILFSVDMNVAIQRGAFDPMTQEIYVAGAISGWGDAAGNPDYELTESSTEDNIYTGIIQATGIETPGTSAFKFITYEPTGAVIGWESRPDRLFEVTGNEVDGDANGFQELTVPRSFFDDVTADDVLGAAATVTFEIDARPAYYVLADSSEINGTPGPETTLDGIWLNGPIMWESDDGGGPGSGITDWLGWGDELEGFSEFGATDADGDSVFTLTLTYPAGALKTLIGKFGVNGSDNEGGFANNHNFVITEGTQTITQVFGAMRQADGLFNDDNGPDGTNYDPYILIDNSTTPPLVMAVRSGGEADGVDTAIEPGAELPDGITLGQSYPNPFTSTATIAYRLEQGQPISVKVYDLTGRLVATLVEGFQPAGDHTVRFDARDLASGTYLYHLEADGQVVSRMMTVLK